VLVWLPILAPLLLGLVSWLTEGIFRFDYLMPAELFPLVVLGAGSLLWAAWRARSYLALIGSSLVIAVVSLAGGQLVAIATGLASGDTPPGGWQWALALGLIIGYALAVVVIGLGGILLLRDLFRSSAPRMGI
jgi:hypothetical protein